MVYKRFAMMRWSILAAVITFVLAATAPALAEGETTTAATTATSTLPAGIGILILLLGLAAIGLVGATMVGRLMPAGPGMVDDDELIEDELQ